MTLLAYRFPITHQELPPIRDGHVKGARVVRRRRRRVLFHPPQRPDGRGKGLLVPSDQGAAGALGGEQFGNGQADAPAAACDQAALPTEREHCSGGGIWNELR